MGPGVRRDDALMGRCRPTPAWSTPPLFFRPRYGQSSDIKLKFAQQSLKIGDEPDKDKADACSNDRRRQANHRESNRWLFLVVRFC
jgi:hypothetical protein